MIKSSNISKWSREDYGLEAGEAYVATAVQDITITNWFCGDPDDDLSKVEDDTLEAKGTINIPSGTSMHISINKGDRIVRLKVIGEYEITERTSNDKKFNRKKILKDSNFNDLFEIGSNGSHKSGKDFGKSVIRSNGSFIIPAGIFWVMFYEADGVSKIEFTDSSGEIKEFRGKVANYISDVI